MLRRLFVVLALAAVVVPTASATGQERFTAHANLQPAGCAPVVSHTIVRLAGCVANAPFTGTSQGTLDMRYSAKVDLARSSGRQQGTLTFHGATTRDTLVLSFVGVVTVATGLSRGAWRMIQRTGTFAKTAPARGTYTSRTSDQGAHISLDVRG
jgi:hypothetical protein